MSDTTESESPEGADNSQNSRERSGNSDAGTVGAIMSGSLASTTTTAAAADTAHQNAETNGAGNGTDRADAGTEQGEAASASNSGSSNAAAGGGAAASAQATQAARGASGGTGTGAAAAGNIGSRETSRDGGSRGDARSDARGDASAGGGRDAAGGSSGGGGGEGAAASAAASTSTEGGGASGGEAASSSDNGSSTSGGGGASTSGGSAASDAANAATQATSESGGTSASTHIGETADGGSSAATATTTATAAGSGGASHTFASPVCFRPGTLVATPEGATPIERLAPGDRVLTADGTAEPVLWIGRQSIDARAGDPLRVLPIRIRAGAVGPGLPSRDLFLSPDHAVAIDGILVHAGALVDGIAVERQSDVPERLDYLHVELARHCLILAEGLAAESFVDNLEHLAFDNWAEREAIARDRPAVPEMDLPRAKSARQVPQALRRRLAARAQVLAQAERAVPA